MNRIRQAVIWLGAWLLLTGSMRVLAQSQQQYAPMDEETMAFLLEQTTGFEEEREPVLPRYLTVKGVPAAGKTLKEAQDWLQEYVDARLNRHVTFAVLGNYYEYEMTSFGIQWDNPEIYDALAGYVLEGNFIEQYKKQKDIQVNPVSLDIKFSVDEALIAQTVTEYVNHYTCDPTNARFTKVEGNIQAVEAELGRSFDPPTITEQLTALMKDFETTETLVYDFPHADIAPQYYAADLQYPLTVLGECTTLELGSDDRRNNIAKSAEGVNDKTVYPGQMFSALSWYGEVTEENGYAVAPTYQDGEQKPGVGGGICQTTTTLYAALLYAEMGIAYRAPHSMMVSYIQPSMDAMVDYKSRADFQAYNTSQYPIYLEAFIEGDGLTVRVWGYETRPANRTVVYDSDILQLAFPDPLYKEVSVNDEICTVGPVHVSKKIHDEVAPHPYLVSRLIKKVMIDGQLTEQTVVNPEIKTGNGDGYDEYEQMQGVIYHASDCLVDNILIEDKSTWLEQRVHHQVWYPDHKTAWNEGIYDSYFASNPQ